MNDIVELFRLPKKAQVNQRVFTKDIVSAADAKGKEKTLLEKSISTVYLVGVLNENTTGLWAFDDGNYMYREIQVYLIALKDASKVKSLNEELQRIFPNPAVMIYKYENQYMIGTAMKRLNKVEKGKTVIDSLQTTSWFSLDDSHKSLIERIDYNRKNLKDLYEYIDYVASAEYVLRVTKRIPEIIDFSIKSKSVMIQRLVDERNKLLAQEDEESSMQGKMRCHMKIQEIEQKLETFR